MSKYIRRRPPRELEIDTDFYAFGSPSDYLSYDISDDRNFYLEMFESYEQDAAAPFTDFAEFMEYMTDVYGTSWTSDVSSKSLSKENPFKDYDEALNELENDYTLWLIEDQSFINEWLYGPCDEEHKWSPHYFKEPQNAHDALKTRRSKRRASTIRARTKLIKQFIPGSGFLWKRYKKSDDGNYDHFPKFWEELADTDIFCRFKTRVKLAAHYEGYFLVAGRFVKYDPTPKEAKITVAHDDAWVISDAENEHSKFYVPEIPQRSPKYHGNISYLPKKQLPSCVKWQDMVHKGTEIVTSNIRSHNNLPKLYHMPAQLRHFINGRI